MKDSLLAFIISIIIFALVMEADSWFLIVLGSILTMLFLIAGLVKGYWASRD